MSLELVSSTSPVTLAASASPRVTLEDISQRQIIVVVDTDSLSNVHRAQLGSLEADQNVRRQLEVRVSAEQEILADGFARHQLGWFARFILKTLNARERAVLDLIGEGLSNREIAQRLFLAEKTVKNYVTAVLAKLGMQRRAQAVALIARRDHK